MGDTIRIAERAATGTTIDDSQGENLREVRLSPIEHAGSGHCASLVGGDCGDVVRIHGHTVSRGYDKNRVVTLKNDAETETELFSTESTPQGRSK